jgi:hypothetical protein
MIYEVGKPQLRSKGVFILLGKSAEKRSGRLASIFDARVIHETYNHGVATGYSVMLQCKCEEHKRAKITPRDLYKMTTTTRGILLGKRPSNSQISRFSRSFF